MVGYVGCGSNELSRFGWRLVFLLIFGSRASDHLARNPVCYTMMVIIKALFTSTQEVATSVDTIGKCTVAMSYPLLRNIIQSPVASKWAQVTLPDRAALGFEIMVIMVSGLFHIRIPLHIRIPPLLIAKPPYCLPKFIKGGVFLYGIVLIFQPLK